MADSTLRYSDSRYSLCIPPPSAPNEFSFLILTNPEDRCGRIVIARRAESSFRYTDTVSHAWCLLWIKWIFEDGRILVTNEKGAWVPFEGITTAQLVDGLVVVDAEKQEEQDALNLLMQPWVVRVDHSAGGRHPSFHPPGDLTELDIKFWPCFSRSGYDYTYTPIIHFGGETPKPKYLKVIEELKDKPTLPIKPFEWNWVWGFKCPIPGYPSIYSDEN